MTRRHMYAALTCALSAMLLGCAAEEGPKKSSGAEKGEVGQTQEPSPAPESAADFIDLAEKAMAGEAGWTFAVEGKEGLTLQGQENAASFKATVQLSHAEDALHSDGLVTADDGQSTAEEVYVIGGKAYVKEAGAEWKQGPVSSPEMRNKVEDPLAALGRFRDYLKESVETVKLSRTDGTVRLRVAVESQQFAEVKDRAYVARALREFEPTAEQLRGAGVAVDEPELTVSSLEETLVLDAETFRIESHRCRFALSVPYGDDDLTYRQDVKGVNRGVFDGGIQLPAGVA
jgi:hypothetical protein